MNDSPNLSIEDIAPLIGQQAIEIIALTKEVQRLRLRVEELEELARFRPMDPQSEEAA